MCDYRVPKILLCQIWNIKIHANELIKNAHRVDFHCGSFVVIYCGVTSSREYHFLLFYIVHQKSKWWTLNGWNNNLLQIDRQIDREGANKKLLIAINFLSFYRLLWFLSIAILILPNATEIRSNTVYAICVDWIYV